MIHWQDLHHSQLTPAALYAVLQLRSAVFVVEQCCPYQDVDGKDLANENRHILGWRDGRLLACARILMGETATPAPLVIGRVVADRAARGEHVGQQLMTQTLAACARHWPGQGVYLGAQAHLQPFYHLFGFLPVTDIYDEDGIPHIGMLRA